MANKLLDVNLINPFILATIEVLDTMAKIRPVRSGLHLKQKNEYCLGDISGVIGFAGDLVGNLAVSFPKDMAIKIVSQMISETPEWESKYLREGVSEIANMIAGSSKGKVFSMLGHTFSLSLPSVISGKGHYVSHPSRMPVMVVEFKISELGLFTLELCVQK